MLKEGEKANKFRWKNHESEAVEITDKAGEKHNATIRIREVRCGKARCQACPHHIYAYARYREGKQVKEKYLGIAR